MKLTVSFGGTKVVVPCGDGGMSVRDLIEKALHRYKKSVSRDSTPTSHPGLLPTVGQTRVHSVTLARDGGLLDWDDCVRDVLDDRELVIAHVGGLAGPNTPIAGDGTSASGESLLSTSSPASSARATARTRLVTATAVPARLQRQHAPPVPTAGRAEAVVVTSSDISQGSKLLVRRGSDPSEGSPSRRRGSESSDNSDDYTKPGPRKERPGPEVFARSASRQSLGNNPALLQWLDAQERLASSEVEDQRSEPVGRSSPEASPVPQADNSLLVVIPNSTDQGRGADAGLIGVSVKPWYMEEHRCDGDNCPPVSQRLIRGMEVHFVAEGGRLAKDGRVKAGDRIVEVNDITLRGLTYQRAQEIFRKASQASELRLRVLPVVPPAAQQHSSDDSGSDSSRPSAAPPVPKRSPNTHLTSTDGNQIHSLASGATTPTPKTNSIDRSAANTKKIGVKHPIQLSKDVDGLGFSLTTRDNATHGPNPVYVKNILPHGNAIKDGRLRAGDRMLEVNGVDVSGSTQSEVVHLLRSVPIGATVRLVISRVSEAGPDDGGVLSAKSSADFDKEDEDSEEVAMEFDIPLNETGAAGLGISVKGRSKRQNSEESLDLEAEGVFINSVITGGAASRDGRLRVNDQLLEVNGRSLRSLPNRAAMSILREAMQLRQGPRPGFIRLRVSRRQRRVAAQVHPRQYNVPAENKVALNPAYTDSSTASTPMDSPQKRTEAGRRRLPPEPTTPTPSGSGIRRSRPVTAPTAAQVMRRFASAEHLDALYNDDGTDVVSTDSSNASGTHTARDSDRRGRTPFRREGMGRRSMSEKRRAHADATKFEFYKEWEAARQARQASDDRGYHTLPSRLPKRPPRPPPDYASVLSAMEDEFALLCRGGTAPASDIKPSRSQLNLAAKSKASPKLDPLLPTFSVHGPGRASSSGGGMKRAVSMESLLSSVRSGDPTAPSVSSHTTGRPLSRSRPNNNSFRRAVDPGYHPDLHQEPQPDPHPTRKPAPPTPNTGGFFKNLFRRQPPPPVAQPASLPTTPVSSHPPAFPARPRATNGHAPPPPVPPPVAAQPPPPPPPPPPRSAFPVPPPGPPQVADSTISSVESRVLQWQRQNMAALWAAQHEHKTKAAVVTMGTPKRAPAPPPVNYEMRGPPPMVSNSVVPPLPPPPNSRMRRHIYEDVGAYEPIGRPTNLSKPASTKGPAPAPPRTNSGSTSGRGAGSGASFEASHPVLSHYMVGDNQDIYARVNKP